MSLFLPPPLVWVLSLALVPVPDPIRVGPPAPHLSRDSSRQLAMSNGAAWQGFTKRWGGRWAARFDERTGKPRFIYAPGVAATRANMLVLDVASLFGVDETELSTREVHPSVKGEIWVWRQLHRGAPVEGAAIALKVVNGRIGGILVGLEALPEGLQPASGESVLVLPRYREGATAGESPVGSEIHLARRSENVGVVRWTDRRGQVVDQYSIRHHANVDVVHLERTIGDAEITSPARDVEVTDSAGTVEQSADDGSHSLSGDISVRLMGGSLQLRANGAEVRVSGTDDLVLDGGGNISEATASVLNHFHVVWDWLEARNPGHPWLAYPVLADVDIRSGACNAWYTSGTINFLVGSGSSCHNYGQIADVIYHEMGHGVHHYALTTGTFAGDISEGTADFISATITGSAIMAPNANPRGDYIREIETDRVYPTHIIGEVHNDGLIWASFLWNLRAQWETSMGSPTGAESTDVLLLGALELGPAMTDAGEVTVLADDDNGDLSDGTPHACELVDLLDRHGLGPGELGVLQMEHEPLGPQASDTRSYPVEVSLYSPTSACRELDADSLTLWYTVDAAAPTPGIDGVPALPWEDGDSGDTGLGGETTGAWLPVSLTRRGDTWTGEIPRQLPTSRVRYFVQVGSIDGDTHAWSHGGIETGVWSFTVGDRQEIWCEDFESGGSGWSHGGGLVGVPEGGMTDQWEIGTPGGGPFMPERPAAGRNVMATGMYTWYLPNNRQYLMAPPQTVSAPGPMLVLAFERFLTVEDGIYDQARILVNGRTLWENPATAGGSQHVLDMAWTLQEIDLLANLSDGSPAFVDGSPMEFGWDLASDGGLEFGGWALDEVCLVGIADWEGHYVRASLEASRGEPSISVAWETPFIAPLEALQLVKKAGGYPTGPEDGIVLWTDLAPVAGAAGAYEDLAVAPGETWYYALFAASTSDSDWILRVDEGRNGAVGETAPPEPIDTGEPADSGTSDGTADGGDGADGGAQVDSGGSAEGALTGGREKPGGSCSNVGLWGGPVGLLAALVGLIRRKERPVRM